MKWNNIDSVDLDLVLRFLYVVKILHDNNGIHGSAIVLMLCYFTGNYELSALKFLLLIIAKSMHYNDNDGMPTPYCPLVSHFFHPNTTGNTTAEIGSQIAIYAKP